MPTNPQMKLVENLLNLSSIGQKPTRSGFFLPRSEKMQDRMFRKMSAEAKIKLMSRFYHFARSLRDTNSYGTRKASSRHR